MLFSELRFWGFFATVFALYLMLPHRWQNRLLLVASYIFYAAWDWRFMGLMAFSTAVSWLVSIRLATVPDPQVRSRLLAVSLFFSLGLLGIFKYLGFFVESFHALLASFGMTADPFLISIILPVGISFYTFQSLSYTIDVYRRDIEACDDPLDFALYVAFFPALVAGPIERASNLLPEIRAPRSVTWEGIGRGTVLCLLGLIKKTVIADGISPSVDAVYADTDPSGAAILLATWFFAIQIYCDFSGYTDIARGVSRMMGFNLIKNFSQPYFSTNPQEFWRRWHISLSTWLRDYLYIGLGGNRGGRFKTWRNLFLTMLLGGLWHGAAWNFVLWGAYQGILLIAHRAFLSWRKSHRYGIVSRVLLIAIFFQVTCYGWLLFRARSFEQIADFTARLTRLSFSDLTILPIHMPPFSSLCGVVFLLFWDLAVEHRKDAQFYRSWPLSARAGLYAVMLYLLAFGATTQMSAFIYFQF